VSIRRHHAIPLLSQIDSNSTLRLRIMTLSTFLNPPLWTFSLTSASTSQSHVAPILKANYQLDHPISPVCFKFRPDIPSSQIDEFKHSVRKLHRLPCVLDSRLVCHGPPLHPPSAQGYHLCLLSFHPGLPGLEAYQASKEHHDVTSRLMFPYIQGESGWVEMLMNGY
jgi:hypothetical protein